MYAKNVVTLLQHLVKDGDVKLDLADEITQAIVVTHKGAVVHLRIKELLAPSQKDQKPAASA
jgi:NAD(P) transhydrogenase subunit alpha